MKDRDKQLIRSLERIRNRFDPDSTATKVKLLAHGALVRFTGPASSAAKWLLRYHETLMFLAAYPDNASIFHAAQNQLTTFSGRMRPALLDHLAGTGLPGTETSYPFDRSNAAWLTKWYPADVRLNWDDFESEDLLQELLPFMAGTAEEMAIDDEEISTKDWVRAAGGDATMSWLMT